MLGEFQLNLGVVVLVSEPPTMTTFVPSAKYGSYVAMVVIFDRSGPNSARLYVATQVDTTEFCQDCRRSPGLLCVVCSERDSIEY